MKSKIFESINDRSNIISAYAKMLNESVEEGFGASELDFVPDSTMKHPVIVYTDDSEGEWIDLDELEYDMARKSNECEPGSNDFYFNLAFEKLGTDGVYDKLLTDYSTSDYRPSIEDLERAGVTSSKDDLISDIVEIGKTENEKNHENDIEVVVPDWAISYLVNGDDSALSEDDKRIVDEWQKHYTDMGYTYAHDGEDMGFVRHPDFGDASNCEKGYFQKMTEESAVESSETAESVKEEHHSYTAVIKNILWSTEAGDAAEENGVSLPSSDKIDFETEGTTEDDIITAINEIFIDSFGFAPDGFDFVSLKKHHLHKVNELTPEEKKNIEDNNLKAINEEGDEVDSDYDDEGIYHEYPKAKKPISQYHQKFRIHTDGSSKFDDLQEKLHDILGGCTKGFFTDNTYEVVQTIQKKLQEAGLFTTITKIENYGIRSTDGLRQGKKYFFDTSWTNDDGKRMTVHGIITIAFAGTVGDPESRYDACVNFFTDDGNYIRVKC